MAEVVGAFPDAISTFAYRKLEIVRRNTPSGWQDGNRDMHALPLSRNARLRTHVEQYRRRTTIDELRYGGCGDSTRPPHV